jgi:hypothetical protein
MTFCCDNFKFGFGQRHERGIFVYVLPPPPSFPDEPLFHIGMRALERSRFGDLREATKGQMAGCMSLSCGTGIRHCPWCGVLLAKFYRHSWQEMLDEKITHEFEPVA